MGHTVSEVDYTRTMLLESAERAFSECCTKSVLDEAEAGVWPEKLWNTLVEIGFFQAAIPEEQGGAGLELADLLAAVRVSGRYSAPIPFGETLIAGWLLARADLEVPAGPLAFGPVTRCRQFDLSCGSSGWVLNGIVRAVPWANRVIRVVLLVETNDGQVIASVDSRFAQRVDKTNLAGEPRAHLQFDRVAISEADVAVVPETSRLHSSIVYGAVLRGLQMAGALQTACDLSVRYASERIAFGKPLNKLPAVQQNLAVLAGQAAAANVAADLMLDALTRGAANLAASVALARVRINEAVEIGARLAHQAHGAIGFTYEHMLHHATRRLWSWRDEFGNDAYWSETVGQQLIEGGADQFWNTITEVAQL